MCDDRGGPHPARVSFHNEVMLDALVCCIDRGSFAHGRCAHCGWVGPARRSRHRAVRDLVGHRVSGCVLAPEIEAPDRERLSARGRS
ncbi:hypothetical protein [Austwickia sp. TVS 96-490-7B]|uniref:hypothetical protein n=1 Tax=Austwickia sp. TVS 96-490-7B TaxID=2830843 RepID=UPI001C593D26|nr:hypothetical protein [Austwickia sp. TVS 96-490-7B]